MYSVALGPFSQTSGNYSVALGYQANATAENSIAIGKDANVTTTNTIQLGNTSVTNVKTSGTLTAGTITYPNTAGSANQVLITDGSGVASWATPVTQTVGDSSTALATTAFVQTGLNTKFSYEVSDEATATGGETSFTLSNTPGTNSKVKMYINGIRISNTAYTTSGTTLTYIPANNGAYALVVGDRIQFDFSY
jgi:hypothetical protein